VSYPRVVLTTSGPRPAARMLRALGLVLVLAVAALVLWLARPHGRSDGVQLAASGPTTPAPAADKAGGDVATAVRAAAQAKEARKCEKYLAELINHEREARHLKKLRLSDRLSGVARAHSEEMRDKGYFSHVSPTHGLRMPEDRYLSEYSGWFRGLAENIARRQGPPPALSEENIQGTHDGLMHSPGHRKNMLSPDAELLGVGIAVDDAGGYWVTEMFLDPWRPSDGTPPPPPRTAKAEQSDS
jgi:uncharacterized protein YkwD